MSGEDAGPGYSAKRGASRLRLRLPAHAITHQGNARVVLCDISLGGAKVFARADLPVGRDIVLKWDRFDAFGTIVWEREGLRGVQFDEPVPVPVLIATRDLQDAGGLNREQVGEWVAEKGWNFGKAVS
jgi:hypothetical protein